MQTAVLANASVRVRYYEPLEDAAWGGGTFALDGAVERIERRESGGFRLEAQGTTRPGPITLEADAGVAATGFRTPLLDLRELGIGTVGDGRIPALTPYWESTTLPGVYFAGNATQGAAGLRKNGIGSASGTVSGFRYNARLLAEQIAKRLGKGQSLPQLARDEIAPFLLSQLRSGPEIWTQKGYLARAVYPDGSTHILPLAHFLDHCEQGSIAVTIEMNPQGEIYPVSYLRAGEEIDERPLPPNHLNDFGGPEYQRALESFL